MSRPHLQTRRAPTIAPTPPGTKPLWMMMLLVWGTTLLLPAALADPALPAPVPPPRAISEVDPHMVELQNLMAANPALSAADRLSRLVGESLLSQQHPHLPVEQGLVHLDRMLEDMEERLPATLATWGRLMRLKAEILLSRADAGKATSVLDTALMRMDEYPHSGRLLYFEVLMDRLELMRGTDIPREPLRQTWLGHVPRSLSEVERFFPPGTPQSARVHGHLGRLLLDLGETDTGLPLLNQSIAEYAALEGPQWRAEGMTLNRHLAEWLARQGLWERAAAACRASAAAFLHLHPSGTPDPRGWLAWAADCAERGDEHEEAAELFRLAWNAARELHGPRDPRTLETGLRLGAALSRAGHPHASRGTMESLLPDLEPHQQKQPLWMVRALTVLADNAVARGDLHDAEAHLRRALVGYGRHQDLQDAVAVGLRIQHAARVRELEPVQRTALPLGSHEAELHTVAAALPLREQVRLRLEALRPPATPEAYAASLGLPVPGDAADLEAWLTLLEHLPPPVPVLSVPPAAPAP
ncbi:MAG: hypothetical protein H7831_10145 [Magnetococcus sp. WYHC-3]